ncbi:10 kDa heat shock protein [Borealophlyctis nickersoniae]|nr:10 kDa heat shock protein [Borealophlyctis nickersoniae]
MASAAAKRIIPLFDRVLIQRIKPSERTASGIFIPEAARGTQNEGLVLAVGPGAIEQDGTRRPVAVNEGDRVLLPSFGGDTVKLGDEELHLYRDRDLLGKLVE